MSFIFARRVVDDGVRGLNAKSITSFPNHPYVLSHLANETGNCCGRPGRACIRAAAEYDDQALGVFLHTFLFFFQTDSSPGGRESFGQSAIIANARITLLSVLKPSLRALEQRQLKMTLKYVKKKKYNNFNNVIPEKLAIPSSSLTHYLPAEYLSSSSVSPRIDFERNSNDIEGRLELLNYCFTVGFHCNFTK